MKASLLVVAFVLGLATPCFAIFGSAVKVYVFTAAEETDTFHVVPRTLGILPRIVGPRFMTAFGTASLSPANETPRRSYCRLRVAYRRFIMAAL
jgi:hypothetical protein